LSSMGIIYEITVETKSPMILPRKFERRIYTSETRVISGSRIRGSILTYLYEQGVTEVTQQSIKPSIITSPAYLVLNKNAEPAIGHALSFYSKLDEHKRVFSTLNPRNILEKLRTQPWTLYPSTPPKIFGDAKGKVGIVKHAMSLPIAKIDNSWRLIKVELFEIESTAIDKQMGRAHTGMLFGYEALPEGLFFKGYLFDSEMELTDLLKAYGFENMAFETFIGRGSSRGFGRCEVTLRKIKPSYRIDEIKSFIEDTKEGYVVLMAYSPLSVMMQPLQFTPVPKVIDLGDWLGGNGKLVLIKLNGGRYAALGGKTRVESWSLVNNLRRPPVEAAREGSIFVYKVEGDYESVAISLALAEFKGISPLASLGLGIIKILTHDYIGG